jgi:hypothetical protein
MRVYYNEHGAAPDVRHTAKQMGVDLGVDKKVVFWMNQIAFSIYFYFFIVNIHNVYHCQVGEKWRFDDYSYLCKGL